MSKRRLASWTVLGVAWLAWGGPARGEVLSERVGSRASVSVEVGSARAPLYPALDGSGRLYFEARPGAEYSVQVTNRSHERIGALVRVDGLNAVSGTLEPIRTPGRMYVLDPWQSVEVRGWRESLEAVRRFVFVDEKASYAMRSGQPNGRLGWVEVEVYRERNRPRELAGFAPEGAPTGEPGRAAPRPAAGAEKARRDSADDERVAAQAAPESPAPAAESFPGTGWGRAAEDRVRLVEFEAEAAPSESWSLRYEYRKALVALGVWRQPVVRDRLRDRERGELGFAKPPKW